MGKRRGTQTERDAVGRMYIDAAQRRCVTVLGYQARDSLAQFGAG